MIEEDKTDRPARRCGFVRGPIFANMILADEINRTPPKTQAALLEAMQEHQVTAGGKLHRLPQPFFVLATQNPIEQEGTYPLPEAQLDRFMFNINVGYPTEDEEFQIVRLTTAGQKIELKHVLSGEEVISLQEIVRKGAGRRSRDPLRAAILASDAQDRRRRDSRSSSRNTSPGARARGRASISSSPARRARC